MNFKIKSLFSLILVIINLCLFINALNLYNVYTVGRFNITDPSSLYIIISKQDHKDNVLISYQDIVIGLSYERSQVSEFANLFSIEDIDYYIDYTLDEQADLKIKNFVIKSNSGAYIIEVIDFVFVYVHSADEFNFNYIRESVDKADILKVNCLDEALFSHSLFDKPIYNLIIDKCSLSDKLLENLYENSIDIYILNSRSLLIKYKNNLLSIAELPL